MNLQTSPLLNFANVLPSLRLIDDILLTIAGNQSLLAIAIKTGLHDRKLPYKVVLKELKESIQDNRRMVVNVLGEAIVNRVENCVL